MMGKSQRVIVTAGASGIEAVKKQIQWVSAGDHYQLGRGNAEAALSVDTDPLTTVTIQ